MNVSLQLENAIKILLNRELSEINFFGQLKTFAVRIRSASASSRLLEIELLLISGSLKYCEYNIYIHIFSFQEDENLPFPPLEREVPERYGEPEWWLVSFFFQLSNLLFTRRGRAALTKGFGYLRVVSFLLDSHTYYFKEEK